MEFSPQGRNHRGGQPGRHAVMSNGEKETPRARRSAPFKSPAVANDLGIPAGTVVCPANSFCNPLPPIRASASGGTPRQHRHHVGHPGPAAASPPRAEYPWRKQPNPGEVTGWDLQLASTTWRSNRKRQREPRHLTECPPNSNGRSIPSGLQGLPRIRWVKSRWAGVGYLQVGVDTRNPPKGKGSSE